MESHQLDWNTVGPHGAVAEGISPFPHSVRTRPWEFGTRNTEKIMFTLVIYEIVT